MSAFIPPLEAGVGSFAGGAADAPDGGNINNASGLAGHHAGNDPVAAVKDRSEIGLDDVIPFFRRHITQKADVGNPGVVDQTVNGAEKIGGSGDKSPGIFIISYIAETGKTAAAHGFNDFFFRDSSSAALWRQQMPTDQPASAKSDGNSPSDTSGGSGN